MGDVKLDVIAFFLLDRDLSANAVWAYVFDHDRRHISLHSSQFEFLF